MKKKTLLIIVSATMIFVGLYYFVPKTKFGCGTSIPMRCWEYKCEKGFLYTLPAFGGDDVRCFLGGDPVIQKSFIATDL